MSPEVAIVLSVGFACATLAWAAWLRFRTSSQSADVASLAQRIERIERESRNVAPAVAPFQMPNRMSIR